MKIRKYFEFMDEGGETDRKTDFVNAEIPNRASPASKHPSKSVMASNSSSIPSVAQAVASDPASSRAWLIATCVIAAVIPAQHASADEEDTLNVVAGAGVTYDSNLFRVANDPQSDIISNASVGLRIDKRYAQQRFQFDITETASRYGNFSQLDFDALDYRGAWLWHFSPRLSGTLSASRYENPVPFEDTLGFKRRDVRTNENYVFSLDAWVSGGWHLLLGASAEKQTSEQPFQTTPDFRSVSGETGVRYLTPSGNSITVNQRLIVGEYLDSVPDPTNSGDNDYRQYEGELQANWILNGYSTVTGRLGWVERKNDIATQRDFSGPVGDLGYRWTPTDKLGFEWIASRRISIYLRVVSSYVVDNVLSFTTVWRARDKVTLRMRLEVAESDFRGGVASGVPTREDTKTTAQVRGDWMLLRSIALGASLEQQRRSSNESPANYDATIASINASFQF
ncbi:MAG: XrtB/PEP-CTERM-associated polysaccharide biosynthesis outer membrane protein EpsL [Burkholderiales bacterium]